MTTYNSPFSGDVIQPTDVSYAEFTISTDLVLQWPINGNATGDYAARIMEITPTVASLSVYMPPANQVSVGQDALITNPGAYALDIVTSTGVAIVQIAAGTAQYIYITDNTTASGTWGVIAFGATTSTANAATLAGLGLLASSNTLNQSHPVSAVANGYTFVPGDRAQTKVWSGGAGTATLPTATTLGDNWFMLFKNAGTGSFTISCTGVETIDGAAAKTFNTNESAFIICTGASYLVIGYGINSSFAFTALVKPVVTGAYSLTNSEAQSVIQEYVGTLTGNVTVTYPPIVNLYVVTNQTVAGGYTLTITTGVVGGATASIPAGQTATLICDGTNFLNANTVQAGAVSLSLLNGTAAAPALNFSSDPTTGLYRPGSGQFGISTAGVSRAVFSSTGLSVTGEGTFSTGISGGTFP